MPAAAPAAAPSRMRRIVAFASLPAVIAVAGGAYVATRPTEPPPEAMLEVAFEKFDAPDDPTAWTAAQALAARVKQKGGEPPGFPGAADFLVGATTYRLAAAEPPDVQPRRYAAAVAALRQAEQLGVAEERRPEWSAALGLSLFRLGRPSAAPLLADAFWAESSARNAAGLALIDMELARHAPEADARAERLLTELVRLPLTPAEQRQADRFLAVAARRAGRLADAEAALSRVGSEQSFPLDWAELRFAQGRRVDARRLLAALPAGFDPTQAAAASYLLGRCAAAEGQTAAAAREFERAAELAGKTAEGVLSAVAAGRARQAAGRDEEASALFVQAVRAVAVESPPLPPERLVEPLRDAYNDWLARSAVAEAVALAASAEPVFGPVLSHDLQARARRHAAEEAQRRWDAAVETERRRLDADRQRLWTESAREFERLADSAADAPAVGQALWTAAEHFRNGRQAKAAEHTLTKFLALDQPALRATALVRRGAVRLDLGRPADAAADFQEALDRHPTDPAAFEARALLGRARLAQGDAARAEAVWRNLLSLPELTPDAAEWRDGLFSLSTLLYRRGSTAAVADSAAAFAAEPTPETADRDAAAPPSKPAAEAALTEAVAKFGEYLLRYPDTEEAAEVRVLRADAARRLAAAALRSAESAPSDFLRQAARRRAETWLTDAVADLRAAQATLSPRADGDRLPRLGQELLKTACFDLGHAYAAMGRDEQAVVAYGAAVNRYPTDRRVVPALLRTAECQRRLGGELDARGTLEQARLLIEARDAGDFVRVARAKSDWVSWIERLREAPAASRPLPPPPTP